MKTIIENPLLATKQANSRSQLHHFYGFTAIIKLSSIALTRSLLYVPYIMYLIGIGNTILMVLIVGALASLKVDCLVQSALEKHMFTTKELIRRAFPRKMSHQFWYIVVFLANMTDYTFIQFQMLNIFRLFIFINFQSLLLLIFIMIVLSVGFHSIMLVNHNLRFLINKVFSFVVYTSVVFMVIACCCEKQSQSKVYTHMKKIWKERMFFSFDRGRILQSLVLLMTAFRSNDDILTIF